MQFVSDMQLEVPQAFPAGVSKWCGRLHRVVDPHCQTPLYCRQEDTGILIAHDEHLLEGATIGTAKYTFDKYWVGINLHPVTRIPVRTPAML